MNSRLLDNLLKTLEKTHTNTRSGRIKSWRVFWNQSQLITVGIKNNQGGSVYTPPAFKDSENADLFLIWEDGKCTKTKVQSVLEDGDDYWKQQLRNWRMAAFEDPYAAEVPTPSAIPQVCIASQDVREIVENDYGYIFEQQNQILSKRPQVAMTNSNTFVLWGENHLTTSTGINTHYSESKYAVSWSFDSIISAGIAHRAIPSKEKINALWEESIWKYNLIQKDAEEVNRNTVVVLAPPVVEQMIEQYILYNFKGENILEEQSHFTHKDFSEKKGIFSDKLTVIIDPLDPMEWGSYKITTEGVPAIRTVLIQDGMLTSPYLNMKDAKRWGLAPTGIPAGAAGIKFLQGDRDTWNETLKQIPDGVLVLSVLGLHTQNPVKGSFSLSAPAALRIKNGSLTGKTNVRISGNIWSIMKDSNTQYAPSPLHRQPYMITECSVEKL